MHGESYTGKWRQMYMHKRWRAGRQKRKILVLHSDDETMMRYKHCKCVMKVQLHDEENYRGPY